jgi:diguanylate cyclase
MSRKAIIALRGWSSVARWTIFGTAACVLISVAFNALFFEDLGPPALERALISAVVLPTVLGVPLFFYLSLRLRGLAITNRRLGLVARTDSLTACLNRGAFASKVTETLQARGTGALLMIDADNFKTINDLYGHEAGDEALTVIARSIRAVVRPGDLVGRMGGEEFAVFLPGVDQSAAEAVAERIRRSVNLAIFTPDGRQRNLAVSIGGVAFDRPATFSELFRIADQRLYGAKQSGRNRAAVVHVADHPFVELRQIA